MQIKRSLLSVYPHDLQDNIQGIRTLANIKRLLMLALKMLKYYCLMYLVCWATIMALILNTLGHECGSI